MKLHHFQGFRSMSNLCE